MAYTCDFRDSANNAYILSTAPEYPLSISWDDQSVIRSKFEAGYTYTRARFTKIPTEVVLHYKYILETDKALLIALFQATKFASIFTWYNHQDNTDYPVRFKSTPKMEYVNPGRWHCDMTLEVM